MITKLTPNMDLTKTYPGVILEDKTITYNDDTVAVYIPIIMCDISKGKPSTNKTVINTTNIFKNSKECSPKCSSIVNERNYLIGHKEDTLNGSEFNVSANDKIQISFTQGKLSAISFRLNPLLNI
jgi:hypothetical protein